MWVCMWYVFIEVFINTVPPCVYKYIWSLIHNWIGKRIYFFSPTNLHEKILFCVFHNTYNQWPYPGYNYEGNVEFFLLLQFFIEIEPTHQRKYRNLSSVMKCIKMSHFRFICIYAKCCILLSEKLENCPSSVFYCSLRFCL